MLARISAFILGIAMAGAPLFIVFGAAALIAFWNDGQDSSAISIEISRLVKAPYLYAIPIFTFAGYLMAESKMPQRVVRLSRALFGWLPGSLAIIAILTCTFFTAFTGASGVTIIALGGLLYPMMVKEEYGESYASGLMTSCGSLGLLLVPSVPIILLGTVSNINIEELYLAGVLPCALLVILLTAHAIFKGSKIPKASYKFDTKELLSAIKDAAWEIPLPLIVLIGVYGKFFPASDAAAITAVYVFVVEVLIHREISLTKDLPRIAKESMVLVGAILIILAIALGFTSFIIDQKVPDKMLEWIQLYIGKENKILFLLALNVFLLIVGAFMDIFSAIMVVFPIILPVAKSIGINEVHLGIIFLTNLEIGYITPPVGINLFISSIRFKKSITYLYKTCLPFLVLLLIGLAVITYWEGLSLSLVNAMK
ncbi:MAG: TRAP transporter large permease subunit [Deltaproteobacteria bacterium]|nr:TRAP transporter large permease subunit [Deltaproteobacteria bacterium]